MKPKEKVTKQRIKKYVEKVATEKFQQLVLERLDDHLRSFKHVLTDATKEIVNKHIREAIKIGPIQAAFEEYCSSDFYNKNNEYQKKINEIEWALSKIK